MLARYCLPEGQEQDAGAITSWAQEQHYHWFYCEHAPADSLTDDQARRRLAESARAREKDLGSDFSYGWRIRATLAIT
jgi:hypothetical protein